MSEEFESEIGHVVSGISFERTAGRPLEPFILLLLHPTTKANPAAAAYSLTLKLLGREKNGMWKKPPLYGWCGGCCPPQWPVSSAKISPFVCHQTRSKWNSFDGTKNAVLAFRGG